MTTPSQLTINAVDVATSSSDLAWEAAANAAPAGTAFLVGEQTKGRGRRGASWMSAQGGMYLSVLLRPNLPAERFFGLSFLAALAIRDELSRHLEGVAVGLKWPNDIIAGGGKLCGILVEVRGGDVVIGTGVNLLPVETDLPDARLVPVSVTGLGGGALSPRDLADAYGRNLLSRIGDYETAGFGPARLEWLRHCAHINDIVRVHTGENPVSGRFVDLDDDGAMVLDDGAGGHTRVTTGDVELLGRASQ